MATLNLGRLKPVFRGSWNNATAYNIDDIVVRNNQSYISIQAGTNQDPATATAYWTLIAAKGVDGDNFGLANKEIAFKTNAGALDGIPIGNAGEFLKVNSGATGYQFAEVGGGLLQYKVAVKKDTQTINSSSGVAITGTEVSLTPASASNKILVRGTICYGGDDNLYGGLKIYRKIGSGSYAVATEGIGNADSNATRYTAPMHAVSGGNSDWKVYSSSFEFLDTPNTTSQVYYQMYSGFYSENSRINEEIQGSDGDHDARPITTLSISELSSTIL